TSCGTSLAMVMSLATMPPSGPSSVPSSDQRKPPALIQLLLFFVRTTVGATGSPGGKSVVGADGVNAASMRENAARAVIGVDGSISSQAAMKPLPSGAAASEGETSCVRTFAEAS